MSELVTTRIRATAAKAGLPHLAETLTEYVQRADAAQMGYLDFLDLVLEEEAAVREERRLRHALRISKMPHHKTIDEYGLSYQPEPRPAQSPRPGHPGVRRGQGQRGAARPARCRQDPYRRRAGGRACRAGYTVCFTTLDDMVRQLKAADAIGRLASKLRTYLRPHVLVLDEVGYLPLGREEANLVFQMISKRYEKGAIVLTPSKAFSNGDRSSATRSWPPRSWTGSCTIARKNRLAAVETTVASATG